jgi:hypothetical protein
MRATASPRTSRGAFDFTFGFRGTGTAGVFGCSSPTPGACGIGGIVLPVFGGATTGKSGGAFATGIPPIIVGPGTGGGSSELGAGIGTEPESPPAGNPVDTGGTGAGGLALSLNLPGSGPAADPKLGADAVDGGLEPLEIGIGGRVCGRLFGMAGGMVDRSIPGGLSRIGAGGGPPGGASAGVAEAEKTGISGSFGRSGIVDGADG